MSQNMHDIDRLDIFISTIPAHGTYKQCAIYMGTHRGMQNKQIIDKSKDINTITCNNLENNKNY